MTAHASRLLTDPPCTVAPDAWFERAYEDEEFSSSARATCVLCPLRVPCLEEAMRMEEGRKRAGRFGLWGGLNPSERDRLQAERDELAERARMEAEVAS